MNDFTLSPDDFIFEELKFPPTDRQYCESVKVFFVRIFVFKLLSKVYPYSIYVNNVFDRPIDIVKFEKNIYYNVIPRTASGLNSATVFFQTVQILDYLHRSIGFVFGIKKKITIEELQNFERASFELKIGSHGSVKIIGNTRARTECEARDHVIHLLFLTEPVEFFEKYFYDYVLKFIELKNKCKFEQGYTNILALYLQMKLKMTPSIHQHLRPLVITHGEHKKFKSITKLARFLI
jgi:hypothetical protein